ncbi:vitamin B12 dependent-methionine synthase activation domain-containing protein [Desulfosporosinus lacus]|uniref:Vitamin B12 dependent methionine synthase, activation domain n=1 Tax=Desulfosporosinus lacus DSM 15449 TaxID=1121420 RepID=A0A1M5ZS26_9FIRM|nr:vitamin B12 dependent-methionine synthase activation domain-containing protein [Desulfosporosinus lacus]SHI27001.1 Vitamin B12 dependent methionine synthase, activation domain [Desulfosporosinus lacus DSM 15449]
MNCIVIKNIPFDLDFEDLLNRLRIKKGTEYEKRIEELVQEAEKNANLKVLYKLSYIEDKKDDTVVIDGVKFSSRILRVNLDNVNRVFPYVATCGHELENWSKGFSDMLEMFWLDTIKELALRSARTALTKELKDKFELDKMANMNPGSLEDWPISQQKELFQLFDSHEKLIGVELKSSFLMTPIKSVSGIFFPTETNYENCMLCPRGACPGRKAPYDEKLYTKKYAL